MFVVNTRNRRTMSTKLEETGKSFVSVSVYPAPAGNPETLKVTGGAGGGFGEMNTWLVIIATSVELSGTVTGTGLARKVTSCASACSVERSSSDPIRLKLLTTVTKLRVA